MPISSETLSIYLPAVLALNLTPGNDMLLCINQGIRNGPLAGVAASAGIVAGSITHTLIAALGLSALMATHSVAFDLVRWAGIGYLIWLAVQAFTRPIAAVLTESAQATLFQAFRQGLVVNLLNPKIALFILAFIPQFVDPSSGSTTLQFILLGLLLNLFGIPINTTVGYFAGGLGKAIVTRTRFGVVLQYVSGVVFLLLAVKLAATPFA